MKAQRGFSPSTIWMTAAGLIVGGIVLIVHGLIWGLALFAFAVLISALAIRSQRAGSAR
jgi:hypothetical protein